MAGCAAQWDGRLLGEGRAGPEGRPRTPRTAARRPRARARPARGAPPLGVPPERRRPPRVSAARPRQSRATSTGSGESRRAARRGAVGANASARDCPPAPARRAPAGPRSPRGARTGRRTCGAKGPSARKHGALLPLLRPRAFCSQLFRVALGGRPELTPLRDPPWQLTASPGGGRRPPPGPRPQSLCRLSLVINSPMRRRTSCYFGYVFFM